MKTNKRDFKLSEDGDIILRRTALSFDGREFRNLEFVEKREALLQTIRVRLISSDPEVIDLTSTNFCANLEDLIGLPNTIETAKLGVEKITASLTFDGLVSFEDLYVRPVPINNTEIVFYVLVRDEDGVIAFEATMNLEDGVRIGRIDYDTIS